MLCNGMTLNGDPRWQWVQSSGWWERGDNDVKTVAACLNNYKQLQTIKDMSVCDFSVDDDIVKYSNREQHGRNCITLGFKYVWLKEW